MLLISIAWRSLWRNRRRSFLVIAAITFAASLTMIKMNVDNGTISEAIGEAARLSTGFIQIQKPGYVDNPTLQKSFVFSPELKRLIDRNFLIKGSSARIQADGLLSYKDHSMGVMIMGISPGSEKTITDFENKISEGHFLASNADQGNGVPEIVLGYRLLQNLKARIGDSVVVLCQGFDGVLGNMFARIAGTYKTGSDEFDRMGAFMTVTDLQPFLSMNYRVNAVAISVGNMDDAPEVTAELNSGLKSSGLVAVPWQILMPQMDQTMKFKHSGDIVFMIILLVVVGFGILNAVLMSVTERFREYGVVLSLGMRQEKLAVTVAVEIFFMIVIGILAGNLVGIGISYYILVHPIVVGGNLAKIYEQYGFNVPVITSTVSAATSILASSTILIISFFSTFYPLWRVLRLEPLKGIRYT
ncbi:MAG TPA: FtsX-like permease family protein [Candidatus Acidoferrales bacterium]|nr:FtsX-like permease family protein [Candidatus Acidoferrales bacterium]